MWEEFINPSKGSNWTFSAIFKGYGETERKGGKIQKRIILNGVQTDGKTIASHLWFDLHNTCPIPSLEDGDTVTFSSWVACHPRGDFQDDLWKPYAVVLRFSPLRGLTKKGV